MSRPWSHAHAMRYLNEQRIRLGLEVPVELSGPPMTVRQFCETYAIPPSFRGPIRHHARRYLAAVGRINRVAGGGVYGKLYNKSDLYNAFKKYLPSHN